MIRVTDLDYRTFMLNSDLIQHIQETPDTVVVLVNGESFRVRETSEDVRRKVIEFRREVGAGAARPAALREVGEKGIGRHGEQAR
jgi:flagellar protein FlbD